MLIGLTGAQRTGKTTMARDFAEASKYRFLETPTSAVMEAHGFDPRLDYPLRDRLHIQGIILEALTKVFADAHPGNCITDRTPLDAAAYMLADISREAIKSPSLEDDVLSYLRRCIDATNRYFGVLVVVQPGIPLKNEPGKALASPAFIEHFTAIVRGLCVDERLKVPHYYIPRHVTDREARVRACFGVMRSATGRAAAELEACQANGIPVH